MLGRTTNARPTNPFHLLPPGSTPGRSGNAGRPHARVVSVAPDGYQGATTLAELAVTRAAAHRTGRSRRTGVGAR